MLTLLSTKKKQIVFLRSVCVCVCVCRSFGVGIQLTLEEHRFELCGFTYMWVFSINILEKILETCDTLQNLTYEPHSLEIQKKNIKRS